MADAEAPVSANDQGQTKTIEVSTHAEKRCRERLGLPRRAVRRTVNRAWRNGVRVVDNHIKQPSVVKIWNQHRWVFDPLESTLITVLPEKRQWEEFESVKQFLHDREMIRIRREKFKKRLRGW